MFQSTNQSLSMWIIAASNSIWTATTIAVTLRNNDVVTAWGSPPLSNLQCLKIKIMTMGMMKVHSTEPKPVAMLTILGNASPKRSNYGRHLNFDWTAIAKDLFWSTKIYPAYPGLVNHGTETAKNSQKPSAGTHREETHSSSLAPHSEPLPPFTNHWIAPRIAVTDGKITARLAAVIRIPAVCRTPRNRGGIATTNAEQLDPVIEIVVHPRNRKWDESTYSTLLITRVIKNNLLSGMSHQVPNMQTSWKTRENRVFTKSYDFWVHHHHSTKTCHWIQLPIQINPLAIYKITVYQNYSPIYQRFHFLVM